MKESEVMGREVYYTGDMANHEGYGEVVNYREDARFGDSFDVRLPDGGGEDGNEPRVFRGLSMVHFSPSPGRRFWWREEWEEFRAARIAEMEGV